jgi:isopenicillin-N epimerase
LVSTNGIASGSFNPESWMSVREQFLLKHERIQMAQMLFASHPAPVRGAIDRYRLAFDQNPAVFFHENWIEKERAVAEAAAR